MLGLTLLAVPGLLLHRAARRGGPPPDLLPLAGYCLLGGGALLMVSLTGWYGSDLSDRMLQLSLKLGYVSIVAGVAHLAVLGSLNKSNHRRVMEGIARRQARVQDDARL